MTEPIKTTHGPLTATEIRDRLIAQAEESDEFRARLLTDPKAVLREDYDIVVPENLNLFVHGGRRDDRSSGAAALQKTHRSRVGSRRRGALLLTDRVSGTCSSASGDWRASR